MKHVASMTTIDLESLSFVTGGFDLGQTLDAGNAMAPKGAEAGGFVGAGIGAGLGMIAGAPFLGITAIPAAWTGAGVGASSGTAIGGALGWTAGAGINAYQQLRGKKP